MKRRMKCLIDLCTLEERERERKKRLLLLLFLYFNFNNEYKSPGKKRHDN